MRWNKMVVTAVTAATAGAMCAAGIATTALAAQASPRGFGTFKTWQAAQRAAGFKLVRPTKLFGLPGNGDIAVVRCEAQKKSTSHVVIANYGRTPFHTLALSQNNSGAACSSLGKVTSLGKVKVNGTSAQLAGKCGMPGLRSCKSTKIFLFLTWRKHGVYYLASSFGESSKTLAAFAAGLRPVG